MPEAPVTNASPLILLSRAGQLQLLGSLWPMVVVPQPVLDEVRAKGEQDVTVRSLSSCVWLALAPTTRVPQGILSWELGAGESAVLAWAASHAGCVGRYPAQHGM